MKIYLSSPILRKGSPSNNYILRDRVVGEVAYWLCTEHQLVNGKYQRHDKRRISRRCYAALNAESRRQHRRYVVRRQAA